jgi:hypothetical protein
MEVTQDGGGLVVLLSLERSLGCTNSGANAFDKTKEEERGLVSNVIDRTPEPHREFGVRSTRPATAGDANAARQQPSARDAGHGVLGPNRRR